MSIHKEELRRSLVPNRIQWYPHPGSGYDPNHAGFPHNEPENARAADAYVDVDREFESTNLAPGTYKIWITNEYCDNIPGEWARVPARAKIEIESTAPLPPLGVRVKGILYEASECTVAEGCPDQPRNDPDEWPKE